MNIKPSSDLCLPHFTHLCGLYTTLGIYGELPDLLYLHSLGLIDYILSYIAGVPIG